MSSYEYICFLNYTRKKKVRDKQLVFNYHLNLDHSAQCIPEGVRPNLQEFAKQCSFIAISSSTYAARDVQN